MRHIPINECQYVRLLAATILHPLIFKINREHYSLYIKIQNELLHNYKVNMFHESLHFSHEISTLSAIRVLFLKCQIMLGWCIYYQELYYVIYDLCMSKKVLKSQ